LKIRNKKKSLFRSYPTTKKTQYASFRNPEEIIQMGGGENKLAGSEINSV